jgi:hypothetical protein
MYSIYLSHLDDDSVPEALGIAVYFGLVGVDVEPGREEDLVEEALDSPYPPNGTGDSVAQSP